MVRKGVMIGLCSWLEPPAGATNRLGRKLLQCLFSLCLYLLLVTLLKLDLSRRVSNNVSKLFAIQGSMIARKTKHGFIPLYLKIIIIGVQIYLKLK